MIALEILVGLLVLVGAGFSFVAAVGLIRLKDVYLRMHAASKAGTLGAGTMLIALAILSMETGVVTRALAGVAFLLLTAPVSAHLLARAAYMAGYRPCAETKIDTFGESLNLNETNR